MKFSFVVLTWNRYKFLEKCLEELTNSLANPIQCEIIVMDNGSTDKTGEVLDRYKANKLIRIIRRKKNYGLSSYKKLFGYARGEYIVVVDDDVLAFPKNMDSIFADYMQTFSNYGFVALNVIQDEFTNGAKPPAEHYTEETIDGKTIQHGPTGGWCTCFRKKQYRKLWWKFMFADINMKTGEDGFLATAFREKLGLKSGIIKNAVCFHASGPYYARQYGHLDREIEKYAQAGLHDFVETYQKYQEGDI
ncbi:glycosyltransferase family 2 protein [Mucilaginibacter sp. PAMB04274]|uniref:glycosyltransferase family 2 protein n=1 Tax=Mucilaginibacter sp. PAMB04274 TaxID=3138568 RepID=UPI0031F626B8